jgi:hypothetical protein
MMDYEEIEAQAKHNPTGDKQAAARRLRRPRGAL